MAKSMRLIRKIEEEILVGQNGKEKKRKLKQGRSFWLLKIENLIQMIFI
jgi:hypothetical protein